jgi:RNA-directed DNA polymerase
MHGKLTRYAEDLLIQCGTAEQAHRALAWASKQLTKLKLRLHSEKTRIVNDRDERCAAPTASQCVGFDLLGFDHRRVILGEYSRRGGGKESYGVLRWPSEKACRKFREAVRLRVGPPMRLRGHFREGLKDLRLYLVGWLHDYRHGQGARVLRKLDRFVRERVARNLARSQPVTKGRRRRSWKECLTLRAMASLPTLHQIKQEAFACYRGTANIRWRAV